MDKYNLKKNQQLGMSHGKARAKLLKSILFHLVQKLNLDTCFQCRKKIENIDELSIEHKVPWLDDKDPQKMFFDLDNISFSHYKCNVGAARRCYKPQKQPIKHGESNAYKNGCRCEICTEAQRINQKKYR